MNTKTKNLISRGSFGAAIAAGPVAAFIGLTNMEASELWMYTFLGTGILAFLIHLFFMDENFDKLYAIKVLIAVSLGWLPFLFLIAFIRGAYLAMFVCLGFFTLTYLMHLLLGVIKINLQEQS